MTLRVPRYLTEGLVLFSIIFAPLTFGATETVPAMIVTVLLTGACLLEFLSPDSPTRQRPSIAWPFAVGLLVLVTLQALRMCAPNGPTVLWPASIDRAATLVAMSAIVVLTAMTAGAPMIFSTLSSWRRLAGAVFLVGLAVAFIGIIQRSYGDSFYYGLRRVRWGEPFGPYPNTDHASNFMAMAALVGVGYVLSGRQDSRFVQHSVDRAAFTVMGLFLVGVLLYGVWLSRSRGAMIALLVGACVQLGAIVLARYRRLSFAAAATLLCVVLASTWIYFHQGLIARSGGTWTMTMLERFSMNRSGLKMFLDRPLFGIGWGCSARLFPIYQEPFLHGRVLHIHNDWLEWACEVGVVGLLLIISGASLLIIRAIRLLRISSSAEAPLRAALIAASVCAGVHSIGDFVLHIPANASVAVLLLILSAAPTTFVPRRSAKDVRGVNH